MQIREFIEGATGSLRNAASKLRAKWGEHRGRRLAVIGLAAVIFTGTGATAAWAITTTDDEPRQPTEAAAEATEKSEEQAVEDVAAEEPSEETSEEPTEEATTEEAEETEEPEEDPGPVVPDPVDGLSSEQMETAAIVIETGKEMGFDSNGWAVALATGMQESQLKNIDYGHHDSVGVFQQRPSMGWGTVEELMDVSTSASKFYGTLEQISGWENMSIAQAAQAVQVSAYPDAYAQWESLAWNIIDAYEAAN
ncbi:hypothetical protein [Glycomyces salinus]|uniref:hypothetical protein n=1 Tax=Glycomyces salinus TaxID=980294 RepID=UPI0018ED1D2B|nr:hypothetical protein [Glycomyces salinus]